MCMDRCVLADCVANAVCHSVQTLCSAAASRAKTIGLGMTVHDQLRLVSYNIYFLFFTSSECIVFLFVLAWSRSRGPILLKLRMAQTVKQSKTEDTSGTDKYLTHVMCQATLPQYVCWYLNKCHGKRSTPSSSRNVTMIS